ncbi:hypothetical protein [Paenibacillus sp. 37]|uniref:hypothetical protein n=1 Tax=Paenibacillus sp. 37 TaxID=2607911 RepID=UPI00122E74DD|nr:hypothetical protein [Paenibacillus sp. 37]
MQISIYDNSQLYISLKDKKIHKHEGSLADIKCKLLYDSNDNFIGIKILCTLSDTGENIVLPEVGPIEFPMQKAIVTQNEDGINLVFGKDVVVHKEVENECIIDLCHAGITGIEPMPYTHIGGREVIKPFIIRDTPGTSAPMWYELELPS